MNYLSDETLGDKLVGAIVWLMQFVILLAMFAIPVLLVAVLFHFILKYW